MDEYTAEALGQVIKKHRLGRKLTQEELAIHAGYARKGAAVSISRIERGEHRPSRDKFTGIASALRTSVEELESAARDLTAHTQSPRSDETDEEEADSRDRIPRRELNARIAAVLDEGTKRQEAVAEIAERVQSHQQTLVSQFLEPFIEVGSQIEGAPAARWSRESDESHQRKSDDKDEAAALHLKAVSSGLKSAIGGGLLGAGAGAAGGAALGAGAFSAAAAFGTASTGTAISTLSGIAATNATWAFLGGGALAAGGGGIAGGVALMTGLVAAPVAVLALGAGLWAHARSAKKERAAYQDLLKAEREMGDLAPSVEALMKFLHAAESVLAEAATFGTRAFTKWQGSLNRPPGKWDGLSEAQQRMFSGLAEVISASAVVSEIPSAEFLALRGHELEMFADRVNVTVAKASDTINKWV